MRRIILAGLVALLPVAALARAPMETNQLVDGNGNPVGTVDNPLVTNGSASSGSVTAPGTSGSQAQAVQGISGGVPLPIQGGNASAVKTDGSATTQPVSAASLPLPSGAATSSNQTATIGSVAPGAAAANSTLAGGVYNSTTPTLTNGQQAASQLDASGNLLVNIATTKFPIPTLSGFYNNSLQNAGVGAGYLQMDKRQQIKSSETGSDDPLVGITPTVTQSGTSLVGKGSQGNLYSAYAINTTTTAGYLACINAASAPATGAAITPIDVATLAGNVGATAAINYGAGPPNGYSTGIVCLVTTSLTTYTAGGNAFIQARVR